MIVICTKCQAKFRVPDEKIGARGAKVRCSKCQTVFLVRPEEAAGAPAAAAQRAGTEVGAARAPAAPPVENPFVAAPVLFDPALSPAPPPRAVPPPLPPPLPSARASDPFAGPAFAPPDAPASFPAPAATPAPDPFSRAPDPFGPAPDPFAPARAADPFAAAAPAAGPPPDADPFAPSAAADPFAPPDATAHATELADLLGHAPPPEVGPEPVAPVTGGLALEERPASPPRPASSAPFDLDAGYDAFADAQGFDPGALEHGAPRVEAAAAAGAAAASLELADAAPAAPRPVAPRAGGALPMAQPPTHAHERIPGRPSRLRAVAVNAVALAALLVAAVAILAVWRTGDASALRPSALLATLRGGGAEGPFAPRDVRSGLYERDRAPPVLFVRGRVISRAPAPVGRVRVRVEVVRAGAVVASGEAIAGAVPTPEEIWATRDPAALARAARAAEPRAPAQVRPGDAVPFLVAIADHPADLAGASLRVEAVPAGSGAP